MGLSPLKCNGNSSCGLATPGRHTQIFGDVQRSSQDSVKKWVWQEDQETWRKSRDSTNRAGGGGEIGDGGLSSLLETDMGLGLEGPLQTELIIKYNPGWVAQWIEHCPIHQRAVAQFPLRAHTWVWGPVPVEAHPGGNR